MTKNEPVSSLKNHRFLVDLFLEMEHRFEVNALKLEGVHLWPLLRLQLGRSFKQTDAIADAGLSGIISGAEADTSDTPLPRNKAERARLAKEHMDHAFAFPKESARRVNTDLEKLAEHSGPVFALQTKIEKYYLERPGGFYAPILDPASEDLAAYGRVQRLALEPLPIECVNQPLKLDMAAFLATNELSEVTIPPDIDSSLIEIETYLQERWPDFPFDRKRIYKRFRQLRDRRAFWYRVYSELRPEFVLVSSFTGWLHALWAAKDLGIPVIDVQHGGQGAIHYPTTHFGDIPKEGYHFLPDVLWLWGNRNTEFASKWLPGGASRHIPVVGGHRGVARWNKNRLNGQLAKLDQDFVAKYHGKANALVTLSYALDPLMPVEMMEAVKLAPEIHWFIRLHPIHRSSAARDQIIATLHEMGCNNFSIDEPTDVQLQTALYVSRVHFTPFSTSVREAIAFGVPSAITHPAGELLFREEIGTGTFGYAVSSNDIVAFARRNIKQQALSGCIQSDNIETAESAVGNIVATARQIAQQVPRLSSTAPQPPHPGSKRQSWIKSVIGRWTD